MTFDPSSPMELTEAAHRSRTREREAGAARERLRREVEREARRRDPESLGLEACPTCGTWRDPVPREARKSVDAFRTYLAMAQARCQCTSDRCDRCHRPFHPQIPAPSYYDSVRRQIVRSGGLALALGHAGSCGTEHGSGAATSPTEAGVTDPP